MRVYSYVFAGVLTAALGLFRGPDTFGQSLYWDINTDSGSGGAGGASPAGIWDSGITANWNTNADGTGAPGVWTDGSDAVFAAGNDATGAYTVTLGGTVSANAMRVEEGNVTISGGTELDLNGTGIIDLASGASASIGSIVGGSAPLTKNGAGTLDLTTANLFNGLTLNGGTLRVNNDTALGVASGPVAISGGTTLSATASTARSLNYAYAIGGNFALGQSSGGTGALTLAGTMDIGFDTKTITVNNGSDTISAIVGGTGGGIQKEGTGTLTLSGANTYTGSTTINGGILAATNATGLGTGGATGGTTTINTGATLQVSGGITIAERININGTGSTGSNGALRKTGNNTTALSGQLTGTGSIIATTGTLRFTQTSGGGSNTGFSGPITATGGATIRFEFISPNQLGQNNVITLDNGTLRNDNSTVPGNGSMISSTQTITLGAGGGTLMYDAAGGLSIINPTSPISGTGGLTKTGQGTIAVASVSTYQGATHVVGGTLRVRSSNERFPNGSALTIDTGTTFDVDGLTETMGSLAGAGTLEINGGRFNAGGDNSSTTFSGQITGSGSGTNFEKQGTGTLTLTGDNPYTGATIVSGGTLLVNNTTNSGTGSGAVTVASGAKLGGSGTVGGAVTNNGTITPGDSIGTLTVNGKVTNGANSHWAIELSGTSADKLVIGGNLDLSAADFLDVTGTGSGTSWLIGTYAGTLTGTFDTVTSGYTVDYSGGNITLNLSVAQLLGDFNSDGKVDAADYVSWRENDTANAPLPNDGGAMTQGDRYTVWRSHFGNTGPGSGGSLGATAVPEPAGMVLGLCGLTALTLRRWSRK